MANFTTFWTLFSLNALSLQFGALHDAKYFFCGGFTHCVTGKALGKLRRERASLPVTVSAEAKQL